MDRLVGEETQKERCGVYKKTNSKYWLKLGIRTNIRQKSKSINLK